MTVATEERLAAAFFLELSYRPALHTVRRSNLLVEKLDLRAAFVGCVVQYSRCVFKSQEINFHGFVTRSVARETRKWHQDATWASLAEETDSERIELILSACNADINIGKSDCALDDRLPLDNFEKGSNC